jgi:hypothetical protein
MASHAAGREIAYRGGPDARYLRTGFAPGARSASIHARFCAEGSFPNSETPRVMFRRLGGSDQQGAIRFRRYAAGYAKGSQIRPTGYRLRATDARDYQQYADHCDMLAHVRLILKNSELR